MKKTIFISLMFLAGLCCLAQNPDESSTIIRIQDDAARGQIIPKEIYGQFSEHLGSCIYGGLWVGKDSPIPNQDGYRLDVLNALKKLQVPVLRWPGGCFADDYHWMDGIGPLDQRARISNNNWGGTLEDNSFGTHEFLNLCELLDCEPYISGNVGSGTPEELAKWVEYMTSDSQSTVANLRRANGRDKAWKVKYLGIGNEAWGCGGNMRPEYYADLFRRYTTYTRNYGGRLYKIASGASDYDYNWTEVLMQGIGTKMDAIAMHFYTVLDWNRKGSATQFSEDEYMRTLQRAFQIEDAIKGHIAIMDKYDPQKRVDLLVDEWGTWFNVEPGTNPGHLFQQSTMRDAIVAGLSLNIFHKYTDRIKMANIAQIVNVLQSMILTRDKQMVLTPTYHVFEMYKVFQDAEFIPIEYNAGSIVSGDQTLEVPALSVTAARKDGKRYVAIVNTDLKHERKIALAADKTVNGATGRILTAKDIHDYNDFGQAAKVEPKAFNGAQKTRNGLEVTIPAMSVVVLELR